MAKVLGYEPKLMRKCTCRECCAIVEYAPNEEVWLTYEDGRVATDEGSKIPGLKCPGCGQFIRI